MPTRFAFCERVTATATSPWHIRALTALGLKPSGGADTTALCGAEVAWDTVPLDPADIGRHFVPGARTCGNCIEVFGDAV